jgi:hypothetical protein
MKLRKDKLWKDELRKDGLRKDEQNFFGESYRKTGSGKIRCGKRCCEKTS